MVFFNLREIFFALSVLFCATSGAYAQSWSPVGGGTNSCVRTLAVFNNDLIVGGDFISAGGNSVDKIAKWNDSAWVSMGSIPNVVAAQCLLVFNNELYVGGSMGIAKWNGTSWISLEEGAHVYSMVVYENNLYAASSSMIKKWNGSGWELIATANSDIFKMIVYKGELIISGGFTEINNLPFSQIAKWNGTGWSSLGVGILMGSLVSLTTFNGELFAGGSFKTSGGNAGDFIAKWNGTAWLPLPLTVDSFVSVMDSIDGKLFVGGSFLNAGTTPANRIAVWDGNSWTTLGSGLNSTPFTLKKYKDHLYVGGDFTQAGGNSALNIAQWDMLMSNRENILNGSIFKLYPNPITSQITIETEHKNKDDFISIYNSKGQELFKKQLSENTTQIDISNLASGLYFVKLINDKTVQIKKIIKE